MEPGQGTKPRRTRSGFEKAAELGYRVLRKVLLVPKERNQTLKLQSRGLSYLKNLLHGEFSTGITTVTMVKAGG